METAAGPLRRDVRGIPLWLLREYLVEIGGQAGQDGWVRGPGWQARLEQMEDFRLGSLAVGQVRIEIGGEAAALAAVAPLLDKKLVRAGG
jgi:hypothetical protein